MKAWVLHDIGDLRLEEAPQPEIADHEVLVAVKAAGICGSDIPRIYESGAHRMPLIPGHEFSGEVIETGKNVEKSWQGKRVGIFPLIPCKTCSSCLRRQYEMCRQYSYLGSRRNGGFAGLAAVPEWNLIELPYGVSFTSAAMLEPMAVALHALRRVKLIQTDQAVVAGLGTIGQILALLLLEQGIQNVFLIGNKAFQKQMAGKLGIPGEHFCDSQREDPDEFIRYHTHGKGADVFFECVGKNETIAQGIRLTAPGGEVCLVGNPKTDISLEQDVYWGILRRQLRITGSWNSSYLGKEEDNTLPDDWRSVLKKLEQKRIDPENLITHRFPIEELEQGLHIMRDKTEDYVKIMIVG